MQVYHLTKRKYTTLGQRIRKQRVLQRIRARRYRQEVIEYLGGKCVVCGFADDLGLEIDHVNPLDKKCSISYTAGWRGQKGELAKCQVLCGTHHRMKTRKNLDSFKGMVRERLKNEPVVTSNG